MLSSNDRHHEMIRAALALRVGAAPDASAVAGAAFGVWHDMSVRLVPLIGERGFDVLFKRAVHLTSASFPWLASIGTIGEDGDDATQLTGLRALLETREATVAAEASHALLASFTELLATLIGPALSERLLLPVWTPHH